LISDLKTAKCSSFIV